VKMTLVTTVLFDLWNNRCLRPWSHCGVYVLVPQTVIPLLPLVLLRLFFFGISLSPQCHPHMSSCGRRDGKS
jgi:hypothetical protein